MTDFELYLNEIAEIPDDEMDDVFNEVDEAVVRFKILTCV